MTPHSCLDCIAPCPQAGHDERPREDDCYEGVVDVPTRIRRVYIAHPMSGYPADYLHNCGLMLQAWANVAASGLHPYCPAADMLLGLLWPTLGVPDPPTVEQYRDWSMAWLEVCDAVFVLAADHRDGRPSEGVCAEITRAGELGIPVVYSLEELLGLRGSEPA